MSDDPKWLAWRRGDDLPGGAAITASAIARAASGRYGGAYAVVAEHLGLTEAPEPNEAMARGQALEPTIVTAAEVLTGLYIRGEQTWCQHPDRPEWRCTVDGFAAPVPDPTIEDCTHVAEAKSRGVHVKPAWDYWNPQVQWQMLVTGMPLALLIEAAFDDAEQRVTKLGLHIVEPDEFAQIALIDLADTLLGHMRAGTLPDPDAGALETVKVVTSAVDPSAEVVDLSEYADDVARLAKLKTAIRDGEDEAKGLEARIRNAVGTATKGVCDGYELTVGKPRRTLTRDGAAALLAERPDLGKTVVDVDLARNVAKDTYEAHLSPTGARALTIKETA